ncbi:DegV family uncharacterized protein [Tissierella praeacuta]|nr:DegV family uncharacterized protein [Tissierella praeacuta]
MWENLVTVKIITDSTSYIPEHIRKELDIRVLSLYVSFPDESIKETDIRNEWYFSLS